MAELFNKSYIATVMKVDKAKRQIAVYIPELMPAIYNGDTMEYQYPTNAGLDIGDVSKNIAKTVSKTNYMWLVNQKPERALPIVGSKVLVKFIDNNPRLSYWEEWNVNNDYDVIEEDKNPKQLSLTISGKQMDVTTNDNITVNIPEYYIANISTKDDKSKEINIVDNFNFLNNKGLVDTILYLEKSMEFLQNEYITRFFSTISELTMTEDEIVHPTDFPVMNVAENANLSDYLDNAKVYLDSIIMTKYALSDYDIITSRKDEVLSSMSVDELTEKLASFAVFIEGYNKSTEEYINDKFNEYKNKYLNGLSEHTNSHDINLLDANTEFNYYKDLLTGLQNLYNEYRDYLALYTTKYGSLSDSDSVKAFLKDNNITEHIMKSNIHSLFDKVITYASENINQFFEYASTLYPRTCKVNYNFVNIANEDDMITKTYSPFSRVEGLSEDESSGICPKLDISRSNIMKYAFNILDWYDDDIDIKDEKYVVYKDTDLYAKFIGMYIEYAYSTEKLNLKVINDETIEYALYYALASSTENIPYIEITDISSFETTILNTTIDSDKTLYIKMVYGDNIELSIQLSNISTEE